MTNRKYAPGMTPWDKKRQDLVDFRVRDLVMDIEDAADLLSVPLDYLMRNEDPSTPIENQCSGQEQGRWWKAYLAEYQRRKQEAD